MSTQARKAIKRLRELGNSEIVAHSKIFCKTGKGQYGEGDRFLGIRVPVVRKCVREFSTMSFEDTLEVLKSPFHEARLLAVLLLVKKYAAAGSAADRASVYRAYLGNTEYINNWDLVDCSAGHIVGAHLYSRDRKPIYRLVKSNNLWERRIGVISTSYFIRQDDFAETLSVAQILLGDPEDLIHKAVGWMLREIGNRELEVEERFLRKHYKQMPRTMLRYAIEKLEEPKRLAYLKGRI